MAIYDKLGYDVISQLGMYKDEYNSFLSYVSLAVLGHFVDGCFVDRAFGRQTFRQLGPIFP